MPNQTIRYRHGPGYDHSHYDWKPLTKRAPIDWPEGAKIAVSAYVYLEYMELDPPADAVADPRFAGALGSFYPDFQNYSRREFGNRVGIFRVLDILERYGFRVTIWPSDGCCAFRTSSNAVLKQASVCGTGWSLNRMWFKDERH